MLFGKGYVLYLLQFLMFCNAMLYSMTNVKPEGEGGEHAKESRDSFDMFIRKISSNVG